ncbi:hypothetical protein [Vulcanisaeta sp. JCM 16161]|uniref:hypothetical protein n=1 Tax=Vulcanisaeta sp. JCM 16161 TaxID=1295372 RepID=UPI0006D18697|nr:hypothetical protein [Vulcanisaeta sp. JCM 16161]
MADALPNIAINILLITIILSSALILYEFMYVFLYNVSVIMNVIMAIAYSLISAYVIYIIAVKVPRKIRNAGKDAAVRYAHWDRLLNEVYQALLPYLNL